jgi:hypothetical protein
VVTDIGTGTSFVLITKLSNFVGYQPTAVTLKIYNHDFVIIEINASFRYIFDLKIMIRCRDKMVVFGGLQKQRDVGFFQSSNDIWVFSLATKTWSLQPIAGIHFEKERIPILFFVIRQFLKMTEVSLV